MSRVILIAWDGADWRILDPLPEKGALPNLQAFLDKGQREVLRSTIPTHSWSAWPLFLTGVDPTTTASTTSSRRSRARTSSTRSPTSR
jgi:predicted AlkP superfamily phosphohydrolase/phosphomutase